MGAIYLVRHGQASFGAVNYDELSAIGRRQATAVGAALRDRVTKIDRVIAGTLQRHLDTARGCLAAMNVTHDIVQDAAWNEFDHEELLVKHEPGFADREAFHATIAAEPDPRAKFEQYFRDAIVRWITGKHDHEYRETWTGFRVRCNAALEALASHKGTSLVFTSGGPISTVVAKLMDMSPERGMFLPAILTNCGVTKIVSGARGTFVSSMNEHGWFEADRTLLTYR